MNLDTAIAITAPHHVQALAVPLLKQYSPDALLVYPGHITILYPFVPFAELEKACLSLRSLCVDIAPFDITLSGYDSFPHTIFMNPVNPEPILTLFHKIQGVFPDYLPFSGAFGPELHPHLTVADLDNEEEKQNVVLPEYEPITFSAYQLHVLYGPHDLSLPWLTYTVIPLAR